MTENEQVLRDEGLANLVAVTNVSSRDHRYGVTLLVGGITVSGYLVPGIVFAEGWADQDPFFVPLKENYATLEEGKQVTAEEIVQTNYINLVDTTIYAGGSRLQVGHWRGLIARVDGWSIAALDPNPVQS